METITKEYKEHLESLEQTDLNAFINKIEILKNKEYPFKEIGIYLNAFIPKEILNILVKEEFIKLFYLDSQAEHLKKCLDLKMPLEDVKTLVYCYNSNKREFKESFKEEKLKKELLERGFIEVEFLKYLDKETEEEYNKRKEDYYKKLNGLKVVCVFDRDKIGLMGSFTEKGEYEGKLIFNDDKMFFLPKRNRTRGQILTSKFYYKEVKK